MQIALNEKEKQLLHALSLNARATLSSIAEAIGTSKQVLSYTLESLEKKDILQGIYAIYNIHRLGFLYHRVFIKLKYTNLKKEQSIIKYCIAHPKIGWVIQYQGEWDLAIAIWSKDSVDFESVFDEITERFGDVILEKRVSISTKIIHLKHNFLTGDQDSTELILGGNPQTITLDSEEENILLILAAEGRKPYTEIAEELDLIPKTVKNKIDVLVEKDVILGYSYRLNHFALQFIHIKAFIYLERYSRKTIEELIQAIKDIPSSFCITKAIGMADLEFEVYVRNIEEYTELMKNLRYKFSESIRDFKTLYVEKEHYVNYFPSTLQET